VLELFLKGWLLSFTIFKLVKIWDKNPINFFCVAALEIENILQINAFNFFYEVAIDYFKVLDVGNKPICKLTVSKV
jgi:hypothetical protein